MKLIILEAVTVGVFKYKFCLGLYSLLSVVFRSKIMYISFVYMYFNASYNKYSFIHIIFPAYTLNFTTRVTLTVSVYCKASGSGVWVQSSMIVCTTIIVRALIIT